MKRTGTLILMLVLVLGAGFAPARAAGGDVNFLLGQKSLDEDIFDDLGVDDQFEYGVLVTLDFQWPVMLAIDFLSSSDDATLNVPAANPLQLHTDVDTTELNLGVRKFWGKDKKLQPFVGGGLALVQLDVRQTESGTLGPGVPFSTVILDDDDTGVGLWINAGLLYRVGDHFNLGLDVRYSDADADLTPKQGGSDLNLDSGGVHYGVMLGYHW